MDDVVVYLQHMANKPIIVYAVGFVVAFFESFAFVGELVPGSVVAVGIGALCFMGYGNVGIAILLSSTGAVLADFASFYLGKKSTEVALFGRLEKKYKKAFKKGEDFFKKYGGISVFVGRFVGPLRPIVPYVAGSMKMNFAVFSVFAVISGILWGIWYVGLGYLFAQNLDKIKQFSIWLEVSIAIGVLLFVVLRRLKHD
ncbi:DedA family protein [Hippea jasoniae]|uniref:DedA family protein n=1 Tax=Hippea jasoniae TaxID=944479 RepID=UPI00054D42F0|nr:DedA family protein [Hippea jasoniae]